MHRFLRQLRSVSDSFRVESASTFSLLGRQYRAADAQGSPSEENVLTDEGRGLLVDALYGALHCRQEELSPRITPGYAHVSQARQFVQALSEANQGSGRWEPGWAVVGRDPDGRWVVERAGLRLWVPADRFRLSAKPGPGSPRGSVQVGKEYCLLLDGFYMALGDVCEEEAVEVVRIYWNLVPRGAPLLTRALTRALNRRRVPFRFKTLRDPLAYRRCDSAVLYIGKSDVFRIKDVLQAVYAEVWFHLREPVSWFARPLAQGVGLAEDPGNSLSFGQHRSEWVAAALSHPEVVNTACPEARFQALGVRLARSGLDVRAPYLNPGSQDGYGVLTEGNAP